MEKPSEIKGIDILQSLIESSRTGKNRELCHLKYRIGRPDGFWGIVSTELKRLLKLLFPQTL